MMYYFYSKNDKNREPIKRLTRITSRLDAARYFAQLKNMTLRDFLRVFGVSR
jgi:hypothetical protein